MVNHVKLAMKVIYNRPKKPIHSKMPNVRLPNGELV